MVVPEDPNFPNNELKNTEPGKSEFTWNFPEDSYSLANKLKIIETGKMSKIPQILKWKMLGESLKNFPVKMMNKLKKGNKQKNSIMTLERKAGIIKKTTSRKNEKIKNVD